MIASNTQATNKKVEFLNYVDTIKRFQCHSNHLPQLFELKKKAKKQTKKNKKNKTKKKQVTLFNFSVIFFS